MAKNNPKKTVSKGAPKLDLFIRPEKQKQYVTYAQAAGYFSLPYYTTVNLAKRANANLHIRKGVIVDLKILIDFMESELKGKGE